MGQTIVKTTKAQVDTTLALSTGLKLENVVAKLHANHSDWSHVAYEVKDPVSALLHVGNNYPTGKTIFLYYDASRNVVMYSLPRL